MILTSQIDTVRKINRKQTRPRVKKICPEQIKADGRIEKQMYHFNVPTEQSLFNGCTVKQVQILIGYL